jgi:hypothetical protein
MQCTTENRPPHAPHTHTHAPAGDPAPAPSSGRERPAAPPAAQRRHRGLRGCRLQEAPAQTAGAPQPRGPGRRRLAKPPADHAAPRTTSKPLAMAGDDGGDAAARLAPAQSAPLAPPPKTRVQRPGSAPPLGWPAPAPLEACEQRQHHSRTGWRRAQRQSGGWRWPMCNEHEPLEGWAGSSALHILTDAVRARPPPPPPHTHT